MRALSIRQPYAYAIVMGYKPVENRDWNTQRRGRILIHAAKKEESGDLEGVLTLIAKQTERTYHEVSEEYYRVRALGAIVGAATITGVVTAMENDWFYGPFGILMAEPKTCKPVECRGALGFFEVPAEVEMQIRNQFGTTP